MQLKIKTAGHSPVDEIVMASGEAPELICTGVSKSFLQGQFQNKQEAQIFRVPLRGESNLQPGMAMNVAQHKLVHLLKTL